ncbi:MAG: EAL domain-containing protein [Pseudomonadota bacterium]
MSTLQEMLGTSLPDTLLIIDRQGVVLDACAGTDGFLFDASPCGRHLSDFWPTEAGEAIQREARKVLKSRRPQSARLTLPGADGQDLECEARFRAHGRTTVLVVLRAADSLREEATVVGLASTSVDHDTETGLRTRHWLTARAIDCFNDARLREDSVAMVVIEFPQLDTINASFGRDVSVKILQLASDRIGARIRRRRDQSERDEIALLARDAIGLVVPGVTGASQVTPLAERISETLAAPFAVEGREFAVKCGIGISLFPRDGNDAEVLLQNAYAALHDRTGQFRARPAFYSDTMPQRSLSRLDVQDELRMAIEQGQLKLRHSPVVNAASGEILAVQVRPVLESPMRGEIGSSRLISFAESTGLSALLLQRTLELALSSVPEVLGNELVDSAVIRFQAQIGQLSEELPNLLKAQCRERGIAPEQICVTAPERAVMRGDTAATLVGLARLGVQVMLREFGAERIRLTDLAAQPFRGVELSNALVQQLRSQSGQRMCNAVARFVHALDMKVGATSVDNSDEVTLLTRYGCDEVAGPLFGEDLSADDLAELLALQRRGIVRYYNQ